MKNQQHYKKSFKILLMFETLIKDENRDLLFSV